MLLSNSTIDEVCREIEWKGPKRTKRHRPPPISFVRECLHRETDSTVSEILGSRTIPVLDETSFDSSTLERQRQLFQAERLVPIRVRVNLKRRTGSDVVGEILAFVQRTSLRDRIDTYYVREGMTITKLNSQASRRGVQAFVVVERFLHGTTDSNPLASLLGDSEGPAHEDWDTSEDRPDRTWKTWKGRVAFTRKVVDQLVELLSPPKKGADYDLLSDIFSLHDPSAPRRPKLRDGDGDETKERIIDRGEPKPVWFRIESRAGGFRVARNRVVDRPGDALGLLVEVAYDVSSGNPLKKWNELDFDFNRDKRIKLTGENVKVRRLAGNRLQLLPESDDFWFAAGGFDGVRDLYVHVETEFNDLQEVER